jgi:hypothetical protein
MSYATAAESAALLKSTLRRAFPATKFSVRLSRGTAYGYCHVSWTDGPSQKAVREIINPFEGSTFDGMTDCEVRVTAIMPDGRESGLRGINVERRISAKLARRCALQVASYFGEMLPEVVETGNDWMLNTPPTYRDNLDWCLRIRQAAEDRTRFAHSPSELVTLNRL